MSADFYVAVNGNDHWSGKLEAPDQNFTDGPFRTVEQARDAVRTIIASGHNGDIRVFIRGGKYILYKTVVFGNEDSGTEETQIVYEAYPGEKPVFSSEIKIQGWQLEGNFRMLHENAANKVWSADIPDMLKLRGTLLRTLYEGNKRLQRARGQGFHPGNLDIDSDDLSTLKFNHSELEQIDNLQDIELVIRPRFPWIMNILGLKAVDEEAGIAKTTIAGTYHLLKCHHFIDNIEETCYIENLMNEIDGPGKWAVDSIKGKIYLWPEGSMPGENITAPLLTEFFRIEGDEAQQRPVKNIIFKGLGFTHGERWTLEENDGTLQHEWEAYDKGTALIRLKWTEKCAVEVCRFSNSGGTAIRMDLYSKNNLISNNLIEHIGGTGILIAGYGPSKKDLSMHNEIYNNHIRHCGEIYWHSPGIFIWHSSSNKISHNCIHHTNYTAITVSGSRPGVYAGYDSTYSHGEREFKPVCREHTGGTDYWKKLLIKHENEDEVDAFQRIVDAMIPFQRVYDNIIEFNEIYQVMEKIGDGNGIYLSDTGTGNIVRYNYIHHLQGTGGQQAIRTDEFMRGTLVYGNVIYKCNTGGINLKHYDNHAVNNFLIDIPTIVHNQGKETEERLFFGYFSLVCVLPKDKIPVDQRISIKKNIIFKSGEKQSFYRVGNSDGGLNEKQIEKGKVLECNIDGNLYFSAGAPEADKKFVEMLHTFGLEQTGAYGDPMFVNPEAGDFSFGENSPAHAMGIEELDVSKCGLTKEFPCEYLVDESL